MPTPESTPSQARPTRLTPSSNASLASTLTAVEAGTGPTIPAAAASRHSPAPPWVTMTSPTWVSPACIVAMGPGILPPTASPETRRDAAQHKRRESDRNIAVADRDRETPAQAPPQLLGDGHRAVAAAGAADRDGGIGLPLAPEPVHGALNEAFGIFQEGLRLRIAEHETHDRLVLARQRRQLRDEEGVGQETDIQDDVRFGGDAVLEAERQQRHGQLALAAAVTLLDQAPQDVDVERAGVDDRARLLPEARQRLPFGLDAGADVRVRQRVAAARLGEAAQQDVV